MHQLSFNSEPSTNKLILPVALITAIAIGWLTAVVGSSIPFTLVAFPFIAALVVSIFYEPKVGLILLIIFSFFLYFLLRHLPGIPFGFLPEIILGISWLSIVFHRSGKFKWAMMKNDLCIMGLIWFIISVLQFFNPAGASIAGAISEIRFTALNWLLIVPLCFLVFNKNEHLNLFLFMITGLSVIAAIYGLKQLQIGLDAADQAFLDAGAAKTHLIWGKLRVFSLYGDAGQFGASQAQIGLICLILALGPFKKSNKMLFVAAALIIFYGMLISGTRGSLFALIAGVFVALFLSKKTKILILGGFIVLSGLLILKYTTIGNGNYNMVRLRTALNPKDPSLNVRFDNQRLLREYLKDYPFGGGLGVIGFNGHLHNSNKFLSTIEPDSYWVKIWAMYGIVGFVIWMGFMMFILGKCCGIIWNIRDDALRQKLLALLAGTAGSFFCSYGNEVMNNMPSSIIFYVSLVFVYLGPKLDKTQINSSTDA